MILVITSNVDSVLFATVRSLSANKDCDRFEYREITGSTFVSGLFSDEPKPAFVDCTGAKIGDIRSVADNVGGYGATVVIYTDYKAKGITKLPAGTKIVSIDAPSSPAAFGKWAEGWTSQYLEHGIPAAEAERIFQSAPGLNDAVKLILNYGSSGIIEEAPDEKDVEFSPWDLISTIFNGDTAGIVSGMSHAKTTKTAVPEIVAMLTGYLTNLIVVNDPTVDSASRVKNDFYHRKNFARIANQPAFFAAMRDMAFALDYDSLSLSLTRMASAMKTPKVTHGF